MGKGSACSFWASTGNMKRVSLERWRRHFMVGVTRAVTNVKILISAEELSGMSCI